MFEPLKKKFDAARPLFMPGGKLSALRSVYDGFETFLFTPSETSRSGVHIHDALDSKRMMIIVVLALVPCLLFGMYNVGYQHWLACGVAEKPFWNLFFYGFLAVIPTLVVAYVTGLGIEFIVAQLRGEEIQEGFLVTGILIPLICPVETPLWMIAVATAFAVIFAKEVFGGTGYNIFNVALVTRAFLFFAYPASMSGDKPFVARDAIFGFGGNVPDSFTGATPLGQLAAGTASNGAELVSITGQDLSTWDLFLGLIPGSVGETSVIAILIGAAILLFTGIGNWRIILSVFAGGAVMACIAHSLETPTYPVSSLNAGEQLCLGGLAFAAVFMASDPVTACRTHIGQYIYGFLIGVVAIVIRTYNNGYPEGAMLAVLLMNALAPLIDYCVVQSNVRRRLKRITTE